MDQFSRKLHQQFSRKLHQQFPGKCRNLINSFRENAATNMRSINNFPGNSIEFSRKLHQQFPGKCRNHAATNMWRANL